MQYISHYNSPIGDIFIAANNDGLTGLWFEGQKYYSAGLDKNHCKKETDIIKETKRWLDIYFSGKQPNFTPSLAPTGSEFRQQVWEILKKIPYGKTITYRDIAKEISNQNNVKNMSPQAVGGAVGHNKISIIIPCHRVIGSNKSLTGYAGGIDKKIQLLELEGINSTTYTVPKR